MTTPTAPVREKSNPSDKERLAKLLGDLSRVVSHPDFDETTFINGLQSESRSCGFLHLYIGPMMADKTTKLKQTLTRLADTGCKVLLICHGDDKRNDTNNGADGKLSTHSSGYERLAKSVDVVHCKKLIDIEDKIADYQVIGIDEGQFYDNLIEGQAELLVKVRYWVNVLHKTVYCAGLDGDSGMNKFGFILDLIPLCDSVEKLKARCLLCVKELREKDFKGGVDKVDAPFTACMVPKQQQKLVGGAKLYQPMCRYHFLNHS